MHAWRGGFLSNKSTFGDYFFRPCVIALSEVGRQESKITRKQEKKENKNATKKVIKKKRKFFLFFLVASWSSSCFLVFLIAFLVEFLFSCFLTFFFFPPLEHGFATPCFSNATTMTYNVLMSPGREVVGEEIALGVGLAVSLKIWAKSEKKTCLSNAK